MNIGQLHDWIMSEDGLRQQFDRIAVAAVAQEFKSLSSVRELPGDIDWQRLLLAASALTLSDDRLHQEAALQVAYAGLTLTQDPVVRDTSAVLFSQLSNERSIKLAEDRRLISPGYVERLGASGSMLETRRKLRDGILFRDGTVLTSNRFQRRFWATAEESQWVSATAPTASGKTYIVLRWMLDHLVGGSTRLVVYLAPTRALVSEIESEIRHLAPSHGLRNLRVTSVPAREFYDRDTPTVLVFTQERLHLFANSVEGGVAADVIIVDEAHKVGDDLRGVILQDAIERLVRFNFSARVVFISPSTDNPQELLSDAAADVSTGVVPSDDPTVSQNLILASQLPRDSRRWQLDLRVGDRDIPIGNLVLPNQPDNVRKRVAYLAAALGDGATGTLVYANGADEAEKIAWQIYGSISKTDEADDPDLLALAELAREDVHPHYQLAELASRGVAFHYGNMPTLLRTEIERLFREGKLHFLVCTSTLIEGVNLACRTIVVRGPRRGRGHHMGPQDFWNLAGRAGRWGREFQGNIVCVDAKRSDVWPNGPPRRARFRVKRETDEVMRDVEGLLAYLAVRWDATGDELRTRFEPVGAYLLSTYLREGTIDNAPWAKRFSQDYVEAIEERLQALAARIEIPTEIVMRHPGVSAVSLQHLLEYFRGRTKPIEELIPATPDSDDAYTALIAIFSRINQHLYPAFTPKKLVPLHALVTVEWMRGYTLPRIINARERYHRERGQTYDIHKIIRETMQFVEQVARFLAPRYLACYLDVLRMHLKQVGREELLQASSRFDLFLEFGVGNRTQLSLISLGLSRSAALAMNEYLTMDSLDEGQLLSELDQLNMEALPLPRLVRREVEILLKSRSRK